MKRANRFAQQDFEGKSPFEMGSFIGRNQLNRIDTAMNGEGGQFYADKFVQIAKVIGNMPTIYNQDAPGDQAIAHLHYFKPGHDWYVTARDTTKKQLMAHGRVNFGDEAGITYISIQSLLENGAELDLHWTPRKLAEI